MSAQPERQLSEQVYTNLKLQICPMTETDWKILFHSSLTGRKMWVFDVSEHSRQLDDELLMLDLSIERALARAHKST